MNPVLRNGLIGGLIVYCILAGLIMLASALYSIL